MDGPGWVWADLIPASCIFMRLPYKFCPLAGHSKFGSVLIWALIAVVSLTALLCYFDDGRFRFFSSHSAKNAPQHRRALDSEHAVHLAFPVGVIVPKGRFLPLAAEPPRPPLTAERYGPAIVKHVPKFDVADHIYSHRSIADGLRCFTIYPKPERWYSLNRYAVLDGFLVGMEHFWQAYLRGDDFFSRVPSRGFDIGFAERSSDKGISLTRIADQKMGIPSVTASRRHRAFVVQHPIVIIPPVWFKGFYINRDPRSLFAYKLTLPSEPVSHKYL